MIRRDDVEVVLKCTSTDSSDKAAAVSVADLLDDGTSSVASLVMESVINPSNSSDGALIVSSGAVGEDIVASNPDFLLWKARGVVVDAKQTTRKPKKKAGILRRLVKN